MPKDRVHVPKDDAAPGQYVRIPIRRRRWGYVVAVGGTAVAALVRWALGREVGDQPTYITFYLVVFAASMVGGTRPGLLAMVLSLFTANILFMEPVGKIGPATTGQAVSMASGSDATAPLLGVTETARPFWAKVVYKTQCLFFCATNGKIALTQR